MVPLGLALPLQGRRGVERCGGRQMRRRRRRRGDAMRAVAREKSGLDVDHHGRRRSTGSAAAEGSFDVYLIGRRGSARLREARSKKWLISTQLLGPAQRMPYQLKRPGP